MIAAVVTGAGLLTGIVVCWNLVGAAGGTRCHAKADSVPVREVAMVLGCPKFIDGRLNFVYKHRVDAAAELYRAGRCRRVMVSSDADAPVMAADVIEAGVPREVVSVDPLGVRTRDSFIRAGAVYGISGGIIVSQRFHNERSLYIVDELGGDWVGYDAAHVGGRGYWLAQFRECFARVKAVLDRYCLKPPARSMERS